MRVARHTVCRDCQALHNYTRAHDNSQCQPPTDAAQPGIHIAHCTIFIHSARDIPQNCDLNPIPWKLHWTDPRETATKNASQARAAANIYPGAGSTVNTTAKKRTPER